MRITALLAGAAFSLIATVASAAPAGLHFVPQGYLVEKNNMTMYVFAQDEYNKSNCYDNCAMNWPPLMAKPDAVAEGDFTLAKRDGDQYQWAYKGQALYYWAGDKHPGDTGGNGMGGVWYLIEGQPTYTPSKAPAQTYVAPKTYNQTTSSY